MTFRSHLQSVLKSGQFAVTSELAPPRGADPTVVREKASWFKTFVDAVNVTDNQTAVARMSSLAAAVMLLREGVEPVWQMVCRDRNRIAMQSDILGGCGLGLRNLLCLSGDHPVCGDQPYARAVFDIDSIQQIQMVRQMRDEARFLSGDTISSPPDMFIGAVANPFASPVQWRVHRLAKKIRAGADFIQTQCVFDMARFGEWICQARDMGLTEKTFIMAGLVPLKSVEMAEYMVRKVPGIDIPDAVIRRIKGVDNPRREEEGIRIACEQIEQLRALDGISGIHLMTINREHKIPEIVERAGLLPRPRPEGSLV
ncbi:MAG: methylenetetrahydrofolate reductase [Desulfobacterales bacterium]|nr:methylenetetrahydrofolate reductase [Desulfobacterales bacterium]MDD4071899.1 methylenetetrahydrofolate reductase [Desulfobacterales bacterium]MDD4392508.1 methylenetetrahydrofolate reductase [Desulfobacterales bacterium]